MDFVFDLIQTRCGIFTVEFRDLNTYLVKDGKRMKMFEIIDCVIYANKTYRIVVRDNGDVDLYYKSKKIGTWT